ncbi:hypothetical protein SBD_5995 [Streptomyces bottropensis ATCC 25435]|uniref:Uncharacterized protein n=1 Tax=Streptomyces bottropensis ATCC 25435 TaxID=1054862 RepID=M3FLG2_9ACTN|nr:hypothetical protein SBD_5995 [Streptomyces bottropensis ATCC 25435]
MRSPGAAAAVAVNSARTRRTAGTDPVPRRKGSPGRTHHAAVGRTRDLAADTVRAWRTWHA